MTRNGFINEPKNKALLQRVLMRIRTLPSRPMLRAQIRDMLFVGEDLTGIDVSVDADKETGVLTVTVGEDKIEAVGSVLTTSNWQPTKKQGKRPWH